MYSDPKLTDAFVKAIKHYFDDNGLEEMDKLGERKFNKKYFDQLESDMTGETEEVSKEKKPKSKTPNKSSQLRVK